MDDQRKIYGLLGPVKSFTFSKQQCNYLQGRLIQQEATSFRCEYDEQGNLSDCSESSQTGNQNTYDKEVDATGQLIREHGYQGGRLKYEVEYEQGRQVKSRYYTPEGAIHREDRFIYDQQGRLVETVVFDAGGRITHQFKTEHSASGRIECQCYGQNTGVSDLVMDIHGNQIRLDAGPIRTVKKIFDMAGNPVEAQFFTEAGDLLKRYFFQVDAHGVIINACAHTFISQCDGLTRLKPEDDLAVPDFVIEFTYDTAGKRLSEVSTLDGEPFLTKLYSYNQRGQLTDEIWYYRGDKCYLRKDCQYDAGGHCLVETEIRYEQDGAESSNKQTTSEYDIQGNWIKRDIVEW
ncbi:MAG: hypothetical protein AB1489_37175, partial [Acidobacteriota bacterium]